MEDFLENANSPEYLKRAKIKMPDEWRAQFSAAVKTLQRRMSPIEQATFEQLGPEEQQKALESIGLTGKKLEDFMERRWIEMVSKHGKWVGDQKSLILKMPSPSSIGQEGKLKYFELESKDGQPVGMTMSNVSDFMTAIRGKERKAKEKALREQGVSVPFFSSF